MKNSHKDFSANLEQLNIILDDAYVLCEKEDYFSAFQIVGEKLTHFYDAINIARIDDIRAIARSHPIFNIFQQDPYTHRAFTKPRGYAGDAVMLDYIYYGTAPSHTTQRGRGIFECTTRSSMGLSVLFRRALLTAYINEAVVKKPTARILSVASGHCRELSNSLALSDNFKGEIIAFDQDVESCLEVEQAYQGKVKTVISGVKKLWQNSAVKLGEFDFIYSAGLYDYLTESQAIKLSESLKSMLKPGGRLVIGNFNRESSGRGYLDLIMDWHLIYRDRKELNHFLGDLTGFTLQLYDDPHRNITYAEIIKE